MKNIDFSVKIQHILEYDGRYPVEAYDFVNNAVKHAIEKIESNRMATRRHVNARELLNGMISFACQEYGPLAWDVFCNWHIYSPRDVGNIVYNLVREQLFSTSENDSPQDFDLNLDLREALATPFRHNAADSRLDVPIIV